MDLLKNMLYCNLCFEGENNNLFGQCIIKYKTFDFRRI